KPAALPLPAVMTARAYCVAVVTTASNTYHDFRRCPLRCTRGQYQRRNVTMALTKGAHRFAWVLVAAAVSGMSASAAELNDYPTAARADYVFACMNTNGNTRRALEQCSCSIDVIASILPYERYVAAETFLSLSQVPGRFGTMFRMPEQARTATSDLGRAQAEAQVRCF